MNFIEFVQNNGWYFLAVVVFLAYLIPKLWPHYLKWSERRSEAAYDAEIKKSKVSKYSLLKQINFKFTYYMKLQIRICLSKNKRNYKKHESNSKKNTREKQKSLSKYKKK